MLHATAAKRGRDEEHEAVDIEDIVAKLNVLFSISFCSHFAAATLVVLSIINGAACHMLQPCTGYYYPHATWLAIRKDDPP